MMSPGRWLPPRISFLSLLFFLITTPLQAERNSTALGVISAAIEAMGGQKYLGIENTQSSGRYFRFDRRGRKAFSLFNDWTVYEPVKSRYQMGEKKRQFVSIHNLETGKGWTLRGEHTVEEIEPDEIEDWKKLVKRDLNFVLKKRMNEEGMDLYYFGPEDIAGSGEHEAVEFLDSTNVSVVIYFSRENHLPAFLETSLTDSEGVRHEEREEYYNWHTIEGVHTPLRKDSYIDEKMSQQIFTEKISYNVAMPETLFQKPQPKK